jgi:P-type Ca2+ transporter type 2C
LAIIYSFTMIGAFDLNTIRGLSEREAAERLKAEGYNELPSAKQRNLFAIALEVAREPMFLLLVASGAVYLILGDVREALMLLAFVFIIIGITFYQEHKTERVLEKLRDLSSPRALVIRDGRQKRIAGREVARGDIVALNEGDRVPADAALLSSTNLSVNESLLTGEAIPVRKIAWDGVTEMSRPGGDDLPFVYSGTLVVQGRGIAQVQATGVRTEMGKIGKALQTAVTEETLLKKETRRLVRLFSVVGLSLCVAVTVLYGMIRADWLTGILVGIALAMAMLPEEFPVILTIFLSLGAWRIAQKRVLTRHTPAVETLGSATVLCVDKTGTLTLNRMSVSKILARGELCDVSDQRQETLPETFHELIEFGILASQRDPFDPMEVAIKELGVRTLSRTEHLHSDWLLLREYPLSPDLLAMSHVWRSRDGRDYVIAAKGAPEAIADLCHFDEAQWRTLSEQIRLLSDEGLRVLGVAKAYFKPTALPAAQHDFDFEFVGLVGLGDPVRPAVPDALRVCYEAGIRVMMITGDYPGTAQHIARQIGLTPMDEVITGQELDRMNDDELRRRIRTVNIFARVMPEQKLRLVNALKARGEIVAMTGDGVNDAPALKAAHIGVAMGGRGTDVAREAAALVLLDDDFSSIVQAIGLGRRIFDNLKKAMAYIVAIHLPIAGMSLVPVLLDWPLILMPFHIAFLHMIIDPACSVVLEAEPAEADVMRRPPRDPKEPVFDRRTIILSLLQGASVLLIVLGVFSIALYRGQGELDARALSFTTLIVANLSLILTNRSWSRTILDSWRSPNAALWWVLIGAVAFLGLVLYVPLLRSLFRFSTLHLVDLGICFAAGTASILWFEWLKALNGRQHPRPDQRAESSAL